MKIILKILISFAVLITVTASLQAQNEVILSSDDFESGFGTWEDGGNSVNLRTESYIIDRNGNTPGGGVINYTCNGYLSTTFVELKGRGNAGSTSEKTLTSSSYDLNQYNQVIISYDYFVTSMDNPNEGYTLQYSSDNGTNWADIKKFRLGEGDFNNNDCGEDDTEQKKVITINNTDLTFSSATRFRFFVDTDQGSTGGGDHVFIDNLEVKGIPLALIAIQNFDGSTPEWTYSETGSGGAVRNSGYGPDADGNFWGLEDDTNQNTITFNDISTNVYENITLSFEYFISDEVETNGGAEDNFTYAIFYNGSSSPASITELITDDNGTNGNWLTQTVTLPNNTSSVRVVFTSDVTAGNEIISLDNVKLSGVLQECSTAPDTAFIIPSSVTVNEIFSIPNTTTSVGNTTYTWDFGDGTTSSEENPTHTYTTPGNYTVTLTATNDCGSDNTTETLTVNVGPIELFFEDFEDEEEDDQSGVDAYSTPWGINANNYDRFEVRENNGNNYFEARETEGGNPDEWITDSFNISGYEQFNFSLDILETNNLGSGDYIRFLYRLDSGDPVQIATIFNDNEGNFDWNLTNLEGTNLEIIIQFRAEDENGNDFHRIDNIKLTGVPKPCDASPVAAFNTPETIFSGQFFAFENTSTASALTAYTWDFGDGNTSTEINPSHSYTTTGEYTISLRATNDCGSDTAETTITVTSCDSPVILPWTEGFETISNTEHTTDDTAIGNCWTYNNTDLGRLQFNVVAHTGERSALFDKSEDGGGDSRNTLTRTLNLSNYTNATDLQLSFWFVDVGNGDENTGEDAVWVRGSQEDEWVKIYDIQPQNFSDNTWHLITGLDIDATLLANDQMVSNTFQIRIGQEDNATFEFDGIAFDDIKITNYPPATALFFEDFEDESNNSNSGVDAFNTAWDTNTTSAGPDRFQVRNQDGDRFFEARETGGDAIWFTNPISITDYADLQLQLDIEFDNDLEANDYLEIYYSLDSGDLALLATYNGEQNDGSYTYDLSQAIGDTIELFVYFNSRKDKNRNHIIDDVVLRGVELNPKEYMYSESTFGGWRNNEDPCGAARSYDRITIEDGAVDIYNNTAVGTITVKPGAGLIIQDAITLSLTDNLTLESVSNNYSSLIIEGELTGKVIYERHTNVMAAAGSTTGANDLISPPLSGQTFGEFRADNSNLPTGTINGVQSWLFGGYNNNASSFDIYNANNDSNLLTSGKGYRAASNDNSTLTFSGTPMKSNVSIAITHPNGGSRWNLVGNPYPSYISLSDFLAENPDIYDIEAAGIYGYDGAATDGWTVWNSAYLERQTEALIAPGQGFFIASKANGATVNFIPSMQRTGNGDDFIQGRTAITTHYLKLQLSNSNQSYVSEFYFSPNASRGFESGYDNIIWGGSAPNFSVYSHLIEDNQGEPLAVQSVHSDDLDNVRIPLGVRAASGQTLSFSLTDIDIPEGVEVYLEDMTTNTFTLLTQNDYTVQPSSTLNGVGRFYLNISNVTLSTNQQHLEALSIYKPLNQDHVVIAGQLYQDSTVTLYDLQGRPVAKDHLSAAQTQHKVSVHDLNTGVYLVVVENRTQSMTQKVIIN